MDVRKWCGVAVFLAGSWSTARAEPIDDARKAVEQMERHNRSLLEVIQAAERQTGGKAISVRLVGTGMTSQGVTSQSGGSVRYLVTCLVNRNDLRDVYVDATETARSGSTWGGTQQYSSAGQYDQRYSGDQYADVNEAFIQYNAWPPGPGDAYYEEYLSAQRRGGYYQSGQQYDQARYQQFDQGQYRQYDQARYQGTQQYPYDRGVQQRESGFQYGQAQYGQGQYGQGQYGQTQYGQAPYGQSQYDYDRQQRMGGTSGQTYGQTHGQAYQSGYGQTGGYAQTGPTYGQTYGQTHGQTYGQTHTQGQTSYGQTHGQPGTTYGQTTGTHGQTGGTYNRSQQTYDQSQMYRSQQQTGQQGFFGVGRGQITRASFLINTDVRGVNEDSLGRIEDVAIDPQSHRVIYIVLRRSGSEDSTRNLFAVPADRIDRIGQEGVRMGISRSELEGRQGFESDQWPNEADTYWSSGMTRSTSGRILKGTELLRKTLQNRQDDRLGDVKDMVLDLNRSRVGYYLVEQDDDRLVAIPALAVQFEDDNDLIVDLTEDRFKQLEAFSENEQRWNDPEWGRHIHRQFNVSPYWEQGG